MESINFQRKTESKQSAKEALRALELAREYLKGITAFGGEIPPTRAEFDAAVFEMRELRSEYLEMRTLLFAYLADQPCPQALFTHWASTQMIWRWRNAEKDPLPSVRLNDKIMITPADFFRALREHGKARQ